ncbi:MAG: hypothetical protein IJZ30_01045 [Alphaproteobacteria bacterium]|nr:hypothetical protein [Alphaproteobacteria bacterium]
MEGASKKVGGDFSCLLNDLKNIKGKPKIIGGSFLYEEPISVIERVLIGAYNKITKSLVSWVWIANIEIKKEDENVFSKINY